MHAAARLGFLVVVVGGFTAIPNAVAAQEQAIVRGVVHDAVTSRPLIGAIVTLDVGEFARTTRTDETGTFMFAGVRPGEHMLHVRWMGYEQQRRSIDVSLEGPPVIVALTRVQALDTVRVRAARQAIYGVVATSALKPIAGAAVHVMGMSRRTLTDANGRFFIEIRTPGPYVVRASASRHRPQTQSVTITPNGGVEVALLLDSMSGSTNALDAAFFEFSQRQSRRLPSRSALVTRAELLQVTTARTLFTAAQSAPAFVRSALTWGDSACVFVDGRPTPGASLQLFDPEEIEAVELYSRSGDGSRTLSTRWPHRAPCSQTGRHTADGRGVVFWVVIWLKH